MKDYVDCCAQCPNAGLVGEKDSTKWKVCCTIDGIERDYNAFCPHYNKSNAKLEQEGERMNVSRFHCKDCKYFYITNIGMCASLRSGKDHVSEDDCVCHAFCPRTTKVRPRRLCDFCERRIPVLDDYGRYTMEIVKTESCPTVNLTTGERTEPDENGEYVLLIFDENGHGRDLGMFPIKYCPLCGRKLGGEKDV